MSKFTYEKLLKLVGEDLKVVNNQDMDFVLRVDKVYRSKCDGDEFDAFNVLYKGDGSFKITEGEFQLYHEALGTESVYIYQNSPIDFQSSISRLREVG